MPQQVKLQVFVSSTFTDLKAERQAAVGAILDSGHIPAGMELFSAGSDEQMKVIQRWIDDSDIYMLLLGGRYGSLEPKSGKSYVQLEYEYAVAKGKALFAIVIKDSWRDERIKRGERSADLIEQDNQDKLNALRKTVLSKMCAFAEDHKDIKLEVARSIRELEQTAGLTGWVRANSDGHDAVTGMSAATRLSAVLQEENVRLRAENEKLKKAVTAKADYGGRTFSELVAMLSAQHVKQTVDGTDIDMNLFELMTNFASHLSRGVSSAFGASKWEIFLFNFVASPLYVYGLVERLKVPTKVSWTKFGLSRMGQAFLTEHASTGVRSKIADDVAGADPVPKRPPRVPPKKAK